MAKKQHYDISMDSIHLEGSLFVPDALEKVAKGNGVHQSGVEYKVPKGLKLTDEYGRAFQIALAQWSEFKAQQERKDLNRQEVTQRFVKELFTDSLGWDGLKKKPRVKIGELSYPLQFLGSAGVPLTVTSYDRKIDQADEMFAITNAGYRKRTPFQLVQEYLNAEEKEGWGVVTNGRQIRLLRSSATLARPQYLEFDLESILEDQRYAEFTSLWRILHGSRILLGDGPDAFCVWEQWRTAGISEGLRVRDGLRDGVTEALMVLGTGFIKQDSNSALRDALQSGNLSREHYFQQLLRLIYRFLFLFAMEERKSEQNLSLLHLQDETVEMANARLLYDDGYSLLRLRERTLRWSSYDDHYDIWQSVQVVFRGLSKGEPLLALPALGGLFEENQCKDIDSCSLSNRDFLHAMYLLRWTSQGTTISAVDYKNMGSEELGSVYESLLELVPVVDIPARKFSFVGIADEHGSTAGNARKTTGSYYTPDSLVQELIKSALIPVVEQRIKDHPENPVEVILSTTVIDPACGSGHFILAAGRKIAEYLATKRSSDGVVTPSQYRHALRDVISHCLYGVDLNPMAVELTRMALWLEGYESGKPLSFLNHHILCGNSLLGMMNQDSIYTGIPNDAMKQLTGDDKGVCADLKKLNSSGLKAIISLKGHDKQYGLLDDENFYAAQVHEIEELEDDDLNAIAKKNEAWSGVLRQADQDMKLIASDLVLAAFLSEKTTETKDLVPTNHTLFRVLTNYPLELKDTQIIDHARKVCEENQVFHWQKYFPHIFEEGGFDVVMGNPPWERIKLQEKEFFATRRPEIAEARNTAERHRMIQALPSGTSQDVALYRAFTAAVHNAEAQSLYVHVDGDKGGRFPLSGTGDVNLYALFTELMSAIKEKTGRAGFIVPTGVATDDSTKVMFSSLVQEEQLVSLYDFENREGIFPGVHRSYKFCLLTLEQLIRLTLHSSSQTLSTSLTNEDTSN